MSDSVGSGVPLICDAFGVGHSDQVVIPETARERRSQISRTAHPADLGRDQREPSLFRALIAPPQIGAAVIQEVQVAQLFLEIFLRGLIQAHEHLGQ